CRARRLSTLNPVPFVRHDVASPGFVVGIAYKNYNTIATTCNNLLKLPHTQAGTRAGGEFDVLAEQRQSMILAMVNQRGSLSITEIQRKLKVSRETIRRDLMLLADRNALRKAYGGALSLERSEPEIAVREVTNAEGKRAIGRLAAGLVPDGASVILASGSTTQSVADALLARHGLTVFTNSIVNCAKLAGHNK